MATSDMFQQFQNSILDDHNPSDKSRRVILKCVSNIRRILMRCGTNLVIMKNRIERASIRLSTLSSGILVCLNELRGVKRILETIEWSSYIINSYIIPARLMVFTLVDLLDEIKKNIDGKIPQIMVSQIQYNIITCVDLLVKAIMEFDNVDRSFGINLTIDFERAYDIPLPNKEYIIHMKKLHFLTLSVQTHMKQLKQPFSMDQSNNDQSNAITFDVDQFFNTNNS